MTLTPEPALAVRSSHLLYVAAVCAAFLLLCVAAMAPLSAAERPAASRQFDIPASEAAQALKKFSSQAGQQLLYSNTDLAGVKTNEVKGELTADAALTRLLAGTPLVATRDQKSGAVAVGRENANPNVPRAAPVTSGDRPAGPVRTGATTGAVAGRIYHPASGEYLRNATVRAVDGPSVASGDGGVYRLSGLAPGEVTVVVEFTGYRNATATVRVAEGETVTRDFELTSAAAGDDAVKLGAFVVSSERAGNAKAIMDQRQSMNVTNSVSSDVFGEVAEGNVGEFLKHLPGVDYDALDGTVRYVSLRGMASEYAGVTVDGMSYPSANAEGVSRAFSFEQVSLSAMESIEVSKTVSADVDASSPAGTINLKTKRAFDRAGRRMSASFSLTGHSEHLTLDRSFGPGDDRQRKILPSAQLDYSDVFLNRRLGIVFGISESNSYIQRAPTTMTYNYTPTAASPAPVALTAIRAQQIIQTVERFAASLTADFKATPHLVLSLSVMYNHSDVWSGQRALTLNTGARTTPVAGADPLTNFATQANGNFTVEPLGIAKVGNGKSYNPRFEYTRGDLTVEGKFGISDSRSGYDPMKYRDSLYSSGIVTLANTRFTAARSSVNSGDWTIQQTAGGDWNNGALYATPTITRDDGRQADNTLKTGEGLVTLRTHRILPVVWKAGGKWKNEGRTFNNSRSGSLFNYVGPGAGVGAWRDHRSSLTFDFSAQDLYLTSITGSGVFLPDIKQMAETFRSHPEYFTPSMSATDYYNAVIANQRDFEEEITAFFLMGTIKVGRLNFRAGVRREETETDALEFDALPSSAVRAAGFVVSGGRASTIPGIDHQFLSRPRLHRKGSYDHLFPSAAIKYNLTRNLDLQLGYSKTIKRPAVTSVAGVWVIDDDALTITAPNVNLRPELSDNFSFRLARYFEPMGVAAVNFFQNNIDGLHLTGTRLSGAAFGADEPAYEGYTFVTTGQSENNVRVRGMELEYTQSLSFLPRPFSGFSVRTSYTRNYAQVTVANMSPHLVTAGLSYSHHRAQLYANMNWAANRPINATGTQYQRHRINVDIGGSYRFSPRLSIFFSVRNILNEPFIRMEKVESNPAAAQFYQKFGITPTIGARATF